MAEHYWIDGTQYAASNFGEFNNGLWIPKEPNVTYGTNGFRLQFKQTGTGTASASTIGADSSGNNNHYTTSGFASTIFFSVMIFVMNFAGVTSNA